MTKVSVILAQHGVVDSSTVDVADLLREIMRQHADPDAPEYNNCDTEPCFWCSQAKAWLDNHKP